MTSARVECRSDHDYIGRPLAFYWQDVRLQVAEVLAQEHTPLSYTFQVRVEDGDVFELEYDTNTDEWSVHQL